jgi:hypothetical protein
LKTLNDRKATREGNQGYKDQKKAFDDAKAALDKNTADIAKEQKIIDDYKNISSPTAAQTTAKNKAVTDKKTATDKTAGLKGTYDTKTAAYKTNKDAQAKDEQYLLEATSFLEETTLKTLKDRVGAIEGRQKELKEQVPTAQAAFDNADWNLTNAKSRKDYEAAKKVWDEKKAVLDTLKKEDGDLKTEFTTKKAERDATQTKFDSAETARKAHATSNGYSGDAYNPKGGEPPKMPE